MDTLDESWVEKKLMAATNTQESVQSLSMWALHHKTQHEKIVSIWFRVLKMAKLELRLTLFYVCNEVVQTCRKKHAVVYKDAFKEILRDAALLVRDASIRPNIERIFNIWGERGVYDADFVSELLALLNNAKVKSALKSRLLADFTPAKLMQSIISCAQLEDAVEEERLHLSSVEVDVEDVETFKHQLKDRNQGVDYANDLAESCRQVRTYVANLETEMKERAALIEMLEQSELYYDAQASETNTVALAYKTFGNRVMTAWKKFEEQRAAIQAAIESPIDEAGVSSSSSIDQDVEDKDENVLEADVGGDDSNDPLPYIGSQFVDEPLNDEDIFIFSEESMPKKEVPPTSSTHKSRNESMPVRRSTSTDMRLSVSEASPSSMKDSSPTQVLPARRTSHTSSVRQQVAMSPVENTARNSVDSKHGGPDTYVASTLSFLPRNIGSLHQPDMFPATVARVGGSTPIRDEEGGSTPVLDEPDDDDIAVAPSYGTPMVLSDEGKSAVHQNLSGGQQARNPEFAYRIMPVNDGVVSSQLPEENGSATAPAPGTIVYRTEVVDGFQSASEAFHPPPDFFRSETDFSVPPPMTIYQMKEEGFSHVSESLPVLSSSTRDVVYTVVTTVQQPAPASYYPVVIEVPSFTEPPPKLATFPPLPASFVHPPPAVFNPSLPPPTLPPTNLPPPGLPPPPTLSQPVSLQYTVPPPANIQVVVPPHTLRSPLPAPPKSCGPAAIYVPQQSTSNQSLVPTIRTLHSSSDDKKTTGYAVSSRFYDTHSSSDEKKTAGYTVSSRFYDIHSSSDDKKTAGYTVSSRFYDTHSPSDDKKTTGYTVSSRFHDTHSSSDDKKTAGYTVSSRFYDTHSPSDDKKMTSTSYRSKSILQGIRHIRDSQQKDSSTSTVSIIPTIGTSGSGQSQAQHKPVQQKPTQPKSPVAGRQVPSLMSLRQPEEVARRLSKSSDGQPSALFAGSKRKLSGSVSEDSLLKPEAPEFVHDCEPELDVGLTGEDIAGQFNDEVDTDTVESDAGNSCEYAKNSVEVVKQIPCLLPSDRRTPFRGRSVTGGGPRSFEVRGTRAAPFPMRYRMPRIPRMSQPRFRGGPMQF